MFEHFKVGKLLNMSCTVKDLLRLKTIATIFSIIYVIFSFLILIHIIVDFISHGHNFKAVLDEASTVTLFASTVIVFFSFTLYGITYEEVHFVFCGAIISFYLLFAVIFSITFGTVSMLVQGRDWTRPFHHIILYVGLTFVISNWLLFWRYYKTMPQGVSESLENINDAQQESRNNDYTRFQNSAII